MANTAKSLKTQLLDRWCALGVSISAPVFAKQLLDTSKSGRTRCNIITTKSRGYFLLTIQQQARNYQWLRAWPGLKLGRSGVGRREEGRVSNNFNKSTDHHFRINAGKQQTSCLTDPPYSLQTHGSSSISVTPSGGHEVAMPCQVQGQIQKSQLVITL